MKTTVSEARTAPEAPLSGFPALQRRGSQAVLDCLSSVEGADSVFLHRFTGTGRQAHATIRRWRFKSAALVLLSATSGR